jgi:hypothetical protein
VSGFTKQRKLPKSKKRDILTLAGRDAILDRLNPLQEITVKLGSKTTVHYSDWNVQIELDSALFTGGGGGGGSGTITQITSTDASVKITNPTGPVVDLSVGLKKMTVQQAYGDYLYCLDASSNPFNIAKPPKLRFSVTSATVNGVAITYGSFSTVPTSGTAEQVRGANSASFGGTIIEQIFPGYQSGDVIFAEPVDHSGVIVAGSELPLLDANTDGRKWVMQYGQ